jgi:hypothetical protein
LPLYTHQAIENASRKGLKGGILIENASKSTNVGYRAAGPSGNHR